MKKNIQFAVVREDFIIESKLVEIFGLKKILLIASGGCTALNLHAWHPELDIRLFDINPHQLHLVQEKISTLQSGNFDQIQNKFNIDDDNQNGLNACGNFEG